MRKLLKTSKCEYENCRNKATEIVYNQIDKKVMLCCNPHADIIVEYDHPEYETTCNNCSCRLPVN